MATKVAETVVPGDIGLLLEPSVPTAPGAPPHTPAVLPQDTSSGETKMTAVVMGTESNPEKSREQLQEEVTMLKEKLTETEDTVKTTQTNLKLQQTRTKQLISIWKTHVERNEQNLKRQGMERDQQLGEVISQLLFFEGQLRKEQKRIVSLLAEKDRVIQKQEMTIQELSLTNSKLLQAFGDVQSMNNKNGFVNGHDSWSASSTKPVAPPMELSLPPDLTSGVNAKDKGHQKPVSRFTAVKNRLRRHKSNLELRNIENTILEETAEELSSSQENIVTRRNNPRRSGRERCKSIAGYPIATDPGLDSQTMAACELESSRYRAGTADASPVPADEEFDQHFENVDYGQNGYHNDNRGTGTGTFESSVAESRHISNSNRPSTLAVDDTVVDHTGKKMSLMDRIRSASSSDVRQTSGSHDSLDSRKSTHAEGKSSPVSETNPFKQFKSMLKRKGSKLRKKRSVSLPQTTNMEYYEALKYNMEKEAKTKK